MFSYVGNPQQYALSQRVTIEQSADKKSWRYETTGEWPEKISAYYKIQSLIKI